MLFPCGIATITGVVLANFNESRGSWYFMIAAMGILAAILLAVSTKAAVRIYWMGFSTSAILYLSLFLVYDWPFDAEINRRPELTSHLLWAIHERFIPLETTNDSKDLNSTLRMVAHQDADFESFQREVDDGVQSVAKGSVTEFRRTNSLTIPSGQTVPFKYSSWSHSFLLTGHLGWALLIGCLSGNFCQYVYRKHRCSSVDIRESEACLKGMKQCD